MELDQVTRGSLPDFTFNTKGEVEIGYGSGSGYGDGYGSGDGYGDGDGYWFAVIRQLAQALVDPVRSRLAELWKSDVVLAFWKSDSDGLPANGGSSSTPASPGLIEKLPGRLNICHKGFHATTEPSKWRGERLWLVALHGPTQQQEDKFAGLEREIICEVK